MLDDTENIRIIHHEASRKYNNIREIVESHDKKAATLLGFIGVLVGIFLVGDFSFQKIILENDYYTFFSLIMGLLFLFFSFIFSCYVFWTKKIYTGAKVRDLISVYTTKSNIDLLKVIIAKLVKAEVEVSAVSKIKARYLKWSIFSLGLSLLFLVYAKLLI